MSTVKPILLRNVCIADELVDIRFAERVLAIGALTQQPGDRLIEGGGTTLLPGLHDHHFHFMAYAAYRQSVDVFSCTDQAALMAQLSRADTGDWIRGVGYHEARHGQLERQDLDAIEAPLRLQHRSGKFWLLNTRALHELDLWQADHAGVERDAQGAPTGRLFRMDQLLRERIPRLSLDIRGTVQALRQHGLTGITDASHTNDAKAAETLENLRQIDTTIDLGLNVFCMGDLSVAPGPHKVMLDDDHLPDFDTVVANVRAAHEQDRGAAFHCISRTELVFALAVLQTAGMHTADRIEHGSLIAEDLIPMLQDTGVVVVSQPGFIGHRGDFFSASVAADERRDLYRYSSLLAAGVPTLASSDAPYGPVDPWRIMANAVGRRTESGSELNLQERVSGMQALSGYLTAPAAPGRRQRTITVGQPTNLCLLDRPLAEAVSALDQVKVRATWIAQDFSNAPVHLA